MYGGIAIAGPERLLFAQRDGEMLLFDVETGGVLDGITPHPFCPEHLEIGACAVHDDTYYLGDTLHHRVRAFDSRGRPRGLLGEPPVPGILHPDEEGVIDEPVALLPLDNELIVVSAGQDQEFAVQRFGYDGIYRGALANPLGGYFRAHGAARIGEEIWIAETEGGAVRRFGPSGAFAGDVKLHTELRRPFRLADDGYDGVLMLLAPESEPEQEVSGVARLEREGRFEAWVVGGGTVQLPFDLAVFPDGRIAVADLPFGEPPDIRVQIFSADGRHVRTFFADRVELGALRDAWSQALPETEFLRRAQWAHYAGGGSGAEDLYRQAIEVDADDLLAWAGLATLYQHVLARPADAEAAYLEAILRGAPEADFTARIAACRHAQGDKKGAIAALQGLLEGASPPEEAQEWLDLLGSWFLEQEGR